MKVVLLAGGLGTRMREETEFKPKPMVEIGGIPILVHLMRVFALQGFTDFVVCAGYKSELLYSFFKPDHWNSWCKAVIPGWDTDRWNVVVIDTGLETPTGGRVAQVQSLVGNNPFICTYGDGLASVNLRKLLKKHEASNRLATVTVAHPRSRFGIVDLTEDGRVSGFREKPVLEDLVSIGFFVFGPEVFDVLGPNSVLENEPLNSIAIDGQLTGFVHPGFWQPLDTYRELLLMQALWESGNPPWFSSE